MSKIGARKYLWNRPTLRYEDLEKAIPKKMATKCVRFVLQKNIGLSWVQKTEGKSLAISLGQDQDRTE